MATDYVLSESAQKIQSTFVSLKNDTDDLTAWRKYLNLFPSTKADFSGIFDRDDFSELYRDSEKYIFVFRSAPENERETILTLLVSITKGGAPGCCDAWSALHVVFVDHALQDLGNFVTMLKNLAPNERRNIINFIADKENHDAFEEYQIIIDGILNLNEKGLVDEFMSARALRMSAKH